MTFPTVFASPPPPPRSHHRVQAFLELAVSPDWLWHPDFIALASQVLGLYVCATMPYVLFLIFECFFLQQILVLLLWKLFLLLFSGMINYCLLNFKNLFPIITVSSEILNFGSVFNFIDILAIICCL